MASRRIREFLLGAGVAFGFICHDPAVATQETAESSRMDAHYMAKPVIVRLDRRLAMAVIPATARLDLRMMRYETASRVARLAKESEFRHLFEGCQIGAEPPFGNLFGMPTFVDRDLADEECIAFIAGTHTDVFVIRYSDYARLVRPRILDIAAQPKCKTKRRPAECDGPMLDHVGVD